eukprot:COSAG01_NODE_412_length_17370_cov_26.910196_11_plen_541_part_00
MQLHAFIFEVLAIQQIKHIFGVPGDFVLGLYHIFEKAGLDIINTCDEQGAGFAADAYARLHGLGVLCVTYGVGGLKVLNTTAQAYAERSPVLIISGAPGKHEQQSCKMLHHKSVHYDTQFKLFSELCLYSAVLDKPSTAAEHILKAIHIAKSKKGPVYLELPRDCLDMTVSRPETFTFPEQKSDELVLASLKVQLFEKLKLAQRPVLLLGTELQRYHLQDAVLDFAHRCQIPMFSTIMAKSVVSESHPLFKGVYQGHLDQEALAMELESSDCVLALGAWLSDVNLGVFTSEIKAKSLIQAAQDEVLMNESVYSPILLKDFVDLLADFGPKRHRFMSAFKKQLSEPFKASSTFISTQRLFDCLAHFIGSNDVIVSDVGDCLFAALSMPIPDRTQFLSPAYYTSMGFAVPAALAVGALYPQKRCIVLVGDGAFQMTGMELSTLAKFDMNPIVIVLDNGGYGTERPIQDGCFNDVLMWDYAALPMVFGKGQSFLVQDEPALVNALAQAVAKPEAFTLLDVKVKHDDFSPVLQKLAAGLSERLL